MNLHLSLKGASSSKVFARYKFLLLDIIVRPEQPTEDEVLELYYLKLRLMDEADISFIRAHSVVLRDLTLLNDVLIRDNRLTFHQKQQQALRLIDSYQMEVKPGNAYYGKKVQAPVPSLLLKRVPSRVRHKRRKRFIGVGYKDHGTMRNIATNGSPDWKEVCSSNIEESVWPRYTEKEKDMLGIFYRRFHRYWDKINQ